MDILNSKDLSAKPPGWWADNARNILDYILNHSDIAPEFKEYVKSALVRGRFLRGSLALRMLQWLPTPNRSIVEQQLIPLLAQVELLHAASCILDDVIDCDKYRRGIPSFQSRAGAAAAILTPMHMINRSLKAETQLLGERQGILSDAFDSMVLGEAYDTIANFGDETLPLLRFDHVLQKTKPLFGAAFWYAGVVTDPNNLDFAMRCKLFGENMGVLYQMANDFHDVFSIGPGVRGESSDSVILTYSMPCRCAVDLAITKATDIGNKMTRGELQTLYDKWSLLGAKDNASRYMDDAISSCISTFPGNPPEELYSIIALITSSGFWAYSYEK